MKFNSFPYPVQLFLLTVFIAGMTYAGLMFSYVGSGLSQIWSPTGLTVILLFIAGPRFLPAVIVGTAVNYLLIVPPAQAFILAAGSGLEAVTGYWLLKRFRFQLSLNSLPEIGKLVLISGGAATAVNAVFTVAVSSLFVPQIAEHFSAYLLLWWMGNLTGVVVVAPSVCIIASRRLELWSGRRLLEFIILTAAVSIISYSVFQTNFFSSVLNYSLAFILFPFAIIASIRFGMVGSVIATYIISLNATLSTQTGLGLFSLESYSTSILLVDLFLLVLGTTALALASLIEERTAAEQKMRINEERYRIVTGRTGQLIYDYNIETGVIHWSGAVEEVTQYTPEEFGTVDVKEWLRSIHPEDRAAAEEELLTSMKEHREYRTEYRFRRKDGLYVDILDRGAFLYRAPQDIVAYRMLGTMADVSSANNTVRQLRESEERYKLFSLLTTDYIYSAVATDKGLVTEWASEAFPRITGYAVADFLTGLSWKDVIHPDDFLEADRSWNSVLNGEPAVIEYRVVTKFGDVRWLRDYVKPIIDESTGAVVRVMGGVQDITDRKRVEERFRILIERSADGILLLDKRGYITFVSASASAIIGYTQDELLERSIFSILHPSEAKKYSFRFGRLTMEFDRSEYLLGRFKHKNGDWVYIEGMVTNLFNNSSVNAFVANFRNVTDRIAAEDRLRRSLQEKEILLKEVHHRVKNNMQVISSLLNLQSTLLKDKASVAMFRESQNRVKSMSLVHEILYQSQDLASVNFSAYVKQLIASLQKSFGSKSGEIIVTVKIAPVQLDIDEAIPCGLIINELVSNSLKYAFPKKRSGEVVVEVKRVRQSVIRLSIRDNGVGLAKRSEVSSSLGLKLVHALTEQLKGTIAIENKRGTSITIEFPIHPMTAA